MVVQAALGRFLDNDDLLWASALTYTTALSIVPLLVLVFSILKGLGYTDQLEPVIAQYVGSPEISQQLLGFVHNMKVTALGSVGAAMLIITDISLLELADGSHPLLQELIRFDTTNPPGRETAAAELCAQLLRAAGLEPRLIARVPERANVIARLAGDGTLPPLLLNAHLDVVPAEAESWTHPPFAGSLCTGASFIPGATSFAGCGCARSSGAPKEKSGKKMGSDLHI